MGNTPSSQHGSTPGSTHASTSAPTQPQPIPTTTAQPATFHSGLTPPQRTPSPPCPPTPPLLPYGGHLSPQNPHALSLAQAHDYSKTVVTTLILEARLAPFYRGLEDYDESFTEEDIGRILTELREKDYAEGVQNSVVEAMKAERTGRKIPRKDQRVEEEKMERDKRERRAYLGAVECPICFLNYPSNINTSRCCQQPICTECFVQMKRGEATLTHLESEPACCPFCVETDFGVIYERPNTFSPEVAISLGSEDAELSVGIGMAPKAQESARRKSVSHKSKEVVTIDEIRPDWEAKLNAVKAAAARKASRRIVMRQVGDRLIPIGFTSARAEASSGADSGGGSPSRREARASRRGSGRERDLEELMIMEAMRLSLLDHEEHQRRQSNEAGPSTDKRKFPRRASDSNKHERGGSTASKLFSKITHSGNRSRSASTASSLKTVSFTPSATNVGASSSTGGQAEGSPEQTGQAGQTGLTGESGQAGKTGQTGQTGGEASGQVNVQRLESIALGDGERPGYARLNSGE